MPLLTLEGIYEDGTVTLDERPVGVKRPRVRVTFVPEPGKTEGEAREEARQRAFARMKEGINFGGGKFNREEIYEERIRDLEDRQDRRR